MVPVVDLSRRGARFAADFAVLAARIAGFRAVPAQDELAAFEGEFAACSARRMQWRVASGASALQLALTATGIGEGHEVLVPAFTAVPTASAVVAAGAGRVAVDVDPVIGLPAPQAIAGGDHARRLGR